MTENVFAAISHWKDFERLCADLLEAEGHKVEAEPFVDRKGTDLTTTQEYQSHNGDSIRLTWHVQCKHYALSGKSLGRKEVEEILNQYQARRKAGDGLLVLVDTDYSEEARNVTDTFLANHPDARIEIWSRRQLRARIERHPHILARYRLNIQNSEYISVFTNLKPQEEMSALVISDQSALSHHLTSILRSLSFDVTFLPFWNYQHPSRFTLMLTGLKAKFDLVVVFLGDSFGLAMPSPLVNVIRAQHDAGASLLFFPFVAWSMRRGAYSALGPLVPVRLVDPSSGEALSLQRIAGEFRRGDFRWLLAFDSFAEDHYVELDPGEAIAPFGHGIATRFGVSHSFEYLSLTEHGRCAWADTSGNPVVIIQDHGPGRVCYLNTCCHSCMTVVPVSSPLEASRPFAFLLRNVLTWLIGKKAHE
jgi:hypothetical protein